MRTKEAESYSHQHPFEEANMIWDWHKTRVVRSFGHRDLPGSEGYRFLLHGLHFGLLPDGRGLQAKWRS
jgi:hypothetical protein